MEEARKAMLFMICHSVLHLLFAVLCFAEGAQWTPNLNGKPGEGYYVEVLIGTPPQKFNVLVDTGSTNFAIAGGLNPDVDNYFASHNSSTYLSKHRKVSVVYTQGYWEGELGNDVIMFPSLNTPTVRCDISEIHKSHNFYMNGSQWQGILGLAYPVISRPDKTVLSWLEALEHHRNKTLSFSLELCGPDEYESKHSGIFRMLDEEEKNVTYASPLLREWFYELLVTRISVGGENVDLPCSTFNTDKTILDSGTTSLRLPTKVFHSVVKMINSTVLRQNVLIPDDFWLLQKMVCWKEVLNWTILPDVSLSLMQNDNSYFTIELPAQSYFRKVEDGSETLNSEYCFKFAIEPSTTGTVLGVIVMEGLRVVFNRSSKVISFSRSTCGPPVQLFGPFSTDKDLRSCSNPLPSPKVSALTVAGFVVAAMLSMFGFAVGYYVCQYLIEKYIKQRQSQHSSETALLSED